MRTVTKYSAYILTFLMLSILTHSCREDPLDFPTVNRDQVMSYSDLFDSFWDEMNNNYNSFYEEENNWDDIYESYSPKFKSLNTFIDKNADPEVAEREMHLAFKYFADIISKLKDRNLKVTIKIPLVTNTERYYYNYGNEYMEVMSFSAGMKYKYSKEDGLEILENYSVNPIVDHGLVRKLMKERLIKSTAAIRETISGFNFISGYLKSAPTIMYINFNKFDLVASIDPVDKLPVLYRPYKKDLQKSFFELLAKLEITDPDAKGLKQIMENNIKDLYDSILLILESDEYKEYLDARAHFFQTEDISKLDALKDKFDKFLTSKVQADIDEGGRIWVEVIQYLNDNKEKHPNQSAMLAYAYWQYYSIRYTLLHESNIVSKTEVGDLNLGSVVKYYCKSYSDVYTRLFNLLTKGEINKLIIDLRGNGVEDEDEDENQDDSYDDSYDDSNYFISRFLTNKSIWGYSRTKEGNGRLNYGPWIPLEIEPHKFNTLKNIPIIILLDKKSGSMSEIASMILKSQGDHVKIIGDNSSGNITGFVDVDDVNGGSKAKTYYFDFYMPNMVYKTLDGKVIEGDGITPDIKVIPTKEEVEKMETTKYDPALEKALEEIRKMTAK